MAYLRHLYNGSTVSIYELGDTTLIGRHLDCNIHIDEPTVSSRHAEVVKNERGWLLRDLGSTNGVVVRGKLVEQQELEPGLFFSLGTHTFEFLDSLPNDLDRTLKIKKSWIPGIYYTE